MKACIVAIGNELLSGNTTDTNSPWLSRQLFEIGIETAGVWVVPDDSKRIIAGLEQASQQGGLILVTGGLGPTDDDLTRQAVADFLGTGLQFHQSLLDQISDFFKSRGRSMSDPNRSQAYIPYGCDVLSNPKGTAPGFWAVKDSIHIAVIPGVPGEMKYMYTEHVLPRVEKLETTSVIVSGKLRCFGAGESDIAQKLGALMQRDRNPLINCTCGSGDILLHIVATASDKETARKMIEQDKVALRECLGELVYGQDDQSLPLTVAELLKKNHKTITLAESCTGGLLAKMLTDIPGSSEYFLGSWVTYSNDAKTFQLDVSSDLIEKFGAVSEPVARVMAENAAKKTGADVAIAITGIAGPEGGTDQKPIGLVYIAISINGECQVQQYKFPPTGREWVRHRSALAALNHLRLQL